MTQLSQRQTIINGLSLRGSTTKQSIQRLRLLRYVRKDTLQYHVMGA